MDCKSIGEKMVAQDNRATAFPLFVVVEDVERAVPDGCGESRRKDPDSWDSSMKLCDSCEKIHNEGGADLPDHCDDCDPDMFWNCEISQEPNLLAGAFFTAEACEEHIKQNGYHYNNPKSYAVGAWRNEEMQEVMRHLIKDCAGKPMGNAYQ